MLPSKPDLHALRRIAQEQADRTGEPWLVVPSPDPRERREADAHLSYAVPEASATVWDRANHDGRMVPNRGRDSP
jgi:hypothetical protein